MAKHDWLDELIPDAGLEDKLKNLQGNILRSHGRDRSVHIFLRFYHENEKKRKEAKKWIAKIARERITSAQKQLEEAKKYDNYKIPGDLFCCFFLSAKGYKALKIPEANLPSDPAFQAGMEKRQLNDPPNQRHWDAGYRGDIHAMLLLADDDKQALRGKCGYVYWKYKRWLRSVPLSMAKSCGIRRLKRVLNTSGM